MKGAFYTGQYRNVFAELGHSQEEIAQKLKDAFHTVFYGPDDEKFYFEAGDDMGYFEDTGNFDARTEGMSYAMMMCVQMDMKNEFDRVWKWARTYMYMEDGYNKGYFAWSCKTTGEKNDLGPAPDGEEFFAMALFHPIIVLIFMSCSVCGQMKKTVHSGKRQQRQVVSI